MKLTHWPLSTVDRDQERFGSLLDRIFEPFTPTLAGNGETRNLLPPVNVSENDKVMTFHFELPGLEEKDIDVQILGDQLVVKAERRFENEEKDEQWHRVEHGYGTINRSVTLPPSLRRDSKGVEATYRKGILSVTVPKVEERPAARIEVKGE